jgi:5-methyltetrahydropteroyltriglutamate--homocysteine methyltransferase
MLRSQDRILTTHCGSLPRPRGLTALYVRRAAGDAVDPAALEAAGRAALEDVVARLIASMSATTASSSGKRSSCTCSTA